MKILNLQVLLLVLALNALHVLAHRQVVTEPPPPPPEPEDCETTTALPPDCEETTTTPCPPLPPPETTPCPPLPPPETTTCPPPPPPTTTCPPTTTTCPTTTTPCLTTTAAPEEPDNIPDPELQPYTGKRDCIGQPDGTIFVENRHCRCYYVCYRGKAKRRRCSSGKWFDRELRECAPKSQVKNCPANRN